jgi:hypothetical protein
MKNLLLILVLLSSMASYAQWETYEYKDEFGDPTGNTFEVFQITGLFSNSVAVNEDCGFVFKHDVGEAYTIIIYPYNGMNHERFVEATFQLLKVKTPNGVKEVEAFVSRKGEVFFGNNNYTTLYNIISKPGEYTILLDYENNYTESKYIFSFVID